MQGCISKKDLQIMKIRVVHEAVSQGVFSNLRDHVLDTPLEEDSHILRLLKMIFELFLKVRARKYAHDVTQRAQGSVIRQVLTKAIIFKGQ